jgi:hypothetical protein
MESTGKTVKVLKVYKYASSGKLIAPLGERWAVIPLNNDFSFSSKGIYHINRSTETVPTSYRIEIEASSISDSTEYKLIRVWDENHLPQKTNDPDASLEERINISPSEIFTAIEEEYIGKKEGNFSVAGSGILLLITCGWWHWILLLISVFLILIGFKIWNSTKSDGNPDKIIEVKEAKERIRNKAELKLFEAMQNIEEWASLNGVEFENYVSRVFSDQGFEVEHTPRSNDKGVDLILRKDNQTKIVQCKAYKKNVGVSAVRELKGIRHLWPEANEAILVALYGFSKQTKEFARESNIELFSIAQDYLKTDYRPGGY